MWKSDLDKRREADTSTPKVVIVNAWESDGCDWNCRATGCLTLNPIGSEITRMSKITIKTDSHCAALSVTPETYGRLASSAWLRLTLATLFAK